jgi:hypothetical protein
VVELGYSFCGLVVANCGVMVGAGLTILSADGILESCSHLFINNFCNVLVYIYLGCYLQNIRIIISEVVRWVGDRVLLMGWVDFYFLFLFRLCDC